MSLFAERIGGERFGKDTAIYKFEKIKRAKREAVINNPGIKLIDMGVGEPDSAADPKIVEVLAREAALKENRFYSDNGIADFQQAAAAYLKTVYSVEIHNPLEQIVHGIGSKPVLAILPLCFVNPGEYTLMTVPGYPILGTYTAYVGGQVYPLPLLEENDYFPDLEAIPEAVLIKAKLLYLNYPNNPTGKAATADFFKKVVAFAKKNNVLVIHDASYAALNYDGKPPLSFLSLPGAMDVGLEIFSLSKAFNMTGWRLSFVAGRADYVKAYATVKDNTDSGQFRAIQKAGIYALEHPEITHATRDKYLRRLELLNNALTQVGFKVRTPEGSFYTYVPAPIGTRDGQVFKNAGDAADFLIRKCLVSTVPWDDAGAYLRLSVTFEAQTPEEEKQVVEEVGKRFMQAGLVFS